MRQTLHEIGAKIIGVVLNPAELRTNDYYYYHYNHKGYESEAADSEHTVLIKSLSIVNEYGSTIEDGTTRPG